MPARIERLPPLRQALLATIVMFAYIVLVMRTNANRSSFAVLRRLVLLPLALLVSCAHTQRYADPTLPPNQVATLECAAPVWIVSIDGKKVSAPAFRDLNQVRVAPGDHRVVVSYWGTKEHVAPAPRINGPVYNAGEVSSSFYNNNEVTTYSMGNITLNFTAKPGVTYSVQSHLGEKNWHAKIVEAAPK